MYGPGGGIDKGDLLVVLQQQLGFTIRTLQRDGDSDLVVYLGEEVEVQ
jgi:hypothetical protein